MIPLDYARPEPIEVSRTLGRFAAGCLTIAMVQSALLATKFFDQERIEGELVGFLTFSLLAVALITSTVAVARRRTRTVLAWVVVAFTSAIWAILLRLALFGT
jgi:hypothetical protein